jgi:hypothetical protein
MPVSNTSALGVRSTNSGGSRWIGRRSVVLTGPRLSIGSPSRLNTRPSVSLPTGTASGAPVSVTSVPRRRPSVLPSATARMRPPPRWLATSPVSRIGTVPALATPVLPSPLPPPEAAAPVVSTTIAL